ncbi:hypothetical protein EXIGLDRAFT_771129 [Exidia glandulosa HHB12029]|uniref:Uncharacterized protein n=1 Tax=Exidia glandulosa HHB12029 TaxID=1314781 RepID=A0A165G7M3_EXIGL|nr:hypothetical protein EXIGLDRAFT_771129 [Exidia glandulosa HHB12029]
MSGNLIGGIVERKPNKAAPVAPSAPSKSSSARGFPVAQHRSQSAFARARQTKSDAATSRPTSVPVVQSTGPRIPPGSSSLKALGATGDAEDWRTDISQQNTATVENMTDEERQRAISEIFDTLGDASHQPADAPLSVDTQQNDASNAAESQADMQITPVGSRPSTPTPLSRPVTPTRSALRSGVSTPRSASRKVSFADVQPHDIHVYESQPSSPRRVLGLLAPATAEDAGVPVQMLNHVVMSSEPVITDDPMDVSSPRAEDDTEAIRTRYFPNEPIDNPSLAWLKQPEGAGYEDKTPRFDLQGKPIPLELLETLPSHLGLHHHAQGTRAGYTLDDLLLLSRSTVPAQRTTMFGVLCSITRQLARDELSAYDLGGTRDQVRERILDAAISVMGEHGSLGVRAVDVLWEGLVGWDKDALAIPDVWLHIPGRADSESVPAALSALPVPTILAHMHTQFTHPALPAESLDQLLSILSRLARHSLETCKEIMAFEELVQVVTRLFLPVRHGAMAHAGLPVPPNPLALSVLRTLAASSREHAQALTETGDTLLRYIVALDAGCSPLDFELAAETLRFYECLGRYGLYSHVAGTAAEYFGRILSTLDSGLPLLSSRDRTAQQSHWNLLRAYLRLTETWVVCATDPHQTTPEHDLLWSQVTGWDWGRDLLALRQSLANTTADVPAMLHADLWAASAAWLEGCKVNSPRGGEAEKDLVLEAFENLESFTGLRDAVYQLSELWHRLRAVEVSDATVLFAKVADHSYTVHQAVRLALATIKAGPGVGPLVQAFAADVEVTKLLQSVASNWSWLTKHLNLHPYETAFLRPVTALLRSLLALHAAGGLFSPTEHVAASALVFSRLMPGDEENASSVLCALLKTATAPELFASLNLEVSQPEIQALRDLEPFLLHALRPSSKVLAPLTPTPASIKSCTTQITSPTFELLAKGGADWPFWPLNDLLHSGSSAVFKSLPPGWDATETDIVRGCFLLARIVQDPGSRMSRAEAVFACMRVFMLEHGQDATHDHEEEVFRDALVERRMRDLLRPFTLALGSGSRSSSSLEDVAARSLAPGTPFYQFYTDLVALYDAISFGHPLFATLLLPPLATRYATDYRKLLFVESSATLKTLVVSLPNVLADDPGEFLEPVEEDAEVLGGMLGALVKGVREFVRTMCVHHVAANVWIGRREKLLKALVVQGDKDVVREVVWWGGYSSERGFFNADAEESAARWVWVQSLGDQALCERLKGLFE